MDKIDTNKLIQQLEIIDSTTVTTSEGSIFSAYARAKQTINATDIDDGSKQAIIKALDKASNPSGYRYINNGIKAALVVVMDIKAIPAKSEPEATSRVMPINRRNLLNLVSDGAIFAVTFIKRSNGELRKMQCRLGVKKHLQGGKLGYSAKQSNLLTVFDMVAKGYRSIPLEAIQSLTVGGQSFTFSGGEA